MILLEFINKLVQETSSLFMNKQYKENLFLDVTEDWSQQWELLWYAYS